MSLRRSKVPAARAASRLTANTMRSAIFSTNCERSLPQTRTFCDNRRAGASRSIASRYLQNYVGIAAELRDAKLDAWRGGGSNLSRPCSAPSGIDHASHIKKPEG